MSDRPIRVPTFATFDDGGSLFVTDSGEWAADDGCVYGIAPGGRTAVWTDEARAFPNGCCVGRRRIRGPDLGRIVVSSLGGLGPRHGRRAVAGLALRYPSL